MPRRALRSYPTKDATDLTDEQWAAIAPLVITPSPNGGRPTDIDRRAIVNALLDKHRTGCQWRMLPKDVPPMSSVRYYFDKWNRDGTMRDFVSLRGYFVLTGNCGTVDCRIVQRAHMREGRSCIQPGGTPASCTLSVHVGRQDAHVSCACVVQ
jgi:transposase